MKIVRSLIVLVLKMFADDGIHVLLNAKVEVTACVAYIIRITRIAFKLSKTVHLILHILLFYSISFYSNVISHLPFFI